MRWKSWRDALARRMDRPADVAAADAMEAGPDEGRPGSDEQALRVRPSSAGGPLEQPPPDGITAAVIRPMTVDDLGTVMSIERETFTVPWTPATFRGLLRRHDAHLFVADVAGRVAGFAVIWIVADQAELGDIAVDAAWRRRGIGTRLLETVLRLTAEKGVRELFLEVRVTNEDAKRLYARYGFDEVGRRRNYYRRPKEDAIVLRKLI